MEFVGGEGLHHELHGGQQLSGARAACGEVHRGERAVVDPQRDLITVRDVEYVEDVAVPRTRRSISEMCTVSPGRA
ncbi:hypothetical protein [Streptomyces sp. NPDC058548]|uniref:hypothetical protein n=1 Tax=Streptomyces sp. NPDC058548 TaxID=3346545 RepID=UPI00365EAB6B